LHCSAHSTVQCSGHPERVNPRFRFLSVPSTDELTSSRRPITLLQDTGTEGGCHQTLRKTKFIQRWASAMTSLTSGSRERNIRGHHVRHQMHPGGGDDDPADAGRSSHMIPMAQWDFERQWLRNQFMKRAYVINDKTVGLVGLGNIGAKVSHTLQSLRRRRCSTTISVRQPVEKEAQLAWAMSPSGPCSDLGYREPACSLNESTRT